MPERVAFLRSINVGKRRVKMADLRAHAEALGFREVRTYIASGNLIYRRGRAQPKTDRTKLERGLAEALGFEVRAFVRDAERLAEIIEQVPFSPTQLARGSLYIGMLQSPHDGGDGPIAALCRDGHEVAVEGRQVYWRVASKLGESKMQPKHLEQALGQQTTLRSRNSLEKLIASFG